MTDNTQSKTTDGLLAFAMVEVDRLSQIVERIGNLPYNPTKYGVELEVHRELWADIQQVMEDYRE
jgi:hypothetical protein